MSENHADAALCTVSHYYNSDFFRQEDLSNYQILQELHHHPTSGGGEAAAEQDEANGGHGDSHTALLDTIWREVKGSRLDDEVRELRISPSTTVVTRPEDCRVVLTDRREEERMQAFLEAERNVPFSGQPAREGEEPPLEMEENKKQRNPPPHPSSIPMNGFLNGRLYGNVSEIDRRAFLRFLIQDFYGINTFPYAHLVQVTSNDGTSREVEAAIQGDTTMIHPHKALNHDVMENKVVLRKESQEEYWKRLALRFIHEGPSDLSEENLNNSITQLNASFVEESHNASFLQAAEDALYPKPLLLSDDGDEDGVESGNSSSSTHRQGKSSQRPAFTVNVSPSFPLEKNDPFYLIDVGDLVRRMAVWRTHFPLVRPYFAVKCNPNPLFIHLLFAMGAGFDCASKEEINLVIRTINENPDWKTKKRRHCPYKSIQIKPEDDIIFANPCKQVGDLLFAKEKKVSYMTFDNESELYKIARCYADAKLILRIKTNDEKAVCAFSTKFGATLDDPQEEEEVSEEEEENNRDQEGDGAAPSRHRSDHLTARRLLQLAKKLKLEIYGVSFHVGSNNGSISAYTSALEDAHRVFQMAAEIGFNLTVLDIGGGYPGMTEAAEDGEGNLPFAAIAAAMNPLLEEYFLKEGVQVISEPGRFFTASTHALAMNVFASRRVHLSEKESQKVVRKFTARPAADELLKSLLGDTDPAVPTRLSEYQYYLNDGLYNSFNCILFDHAAPRLYVLPEEERRREEGEGEGEATLRLTTLFGPTCDSMDCILKQELFPILRQGDWLLATNMGSYTVAAGCAFNGFSTRRREYICSIDL